MTGRGTALGAITLINATATGRGCALAVDAKTTATWRWQGDALDWRGMTDDALATQILHRIQQVLDRRDGAVIDCASPFPPSRGLKTSSAAAIAMARAGLDAAGHPLEGLDLEALCIDAAIAAGVTLTGAFDDQIAVARGGCHVTDNRQRSILATIPVEPLHVAIWVPFEAIPKSVVKHVDASSIAAPINAALEHALAGDLGAAITANGAAFHELYRAAGLPVTDAPVRVALQHGALGAGLSGTGPAVAALFEEDLDLPSVPGGQWHWTRSVEASP